MVCCRPSSAVFKMFVSRGKCRCTNIKLLQRAGRGMSSMEPITETPRLPPLPTIRDIVHLYRLKAVKQLSQNFLMDQRIHNKIVNAAGKMKGSYVCEVGPGPGGISRSILNKGAAQLTVVEKDRRFLPSLEYLADAANNKLVIHLADILDFNMEDIFPKELTRDWHSDPPNIHVIGNLPFNISTPLIIRWLRDCSNRQGVFSYGRVPLTLTFQKEVAERMVAPIVSKQRCRLSIMCQYLCDVQHKFTIPGKAFVPKPEVDAGVVHFVPLKVPLIPLPFEVVEKFVMSVFHFRQKHCIRGVEILFPVKEREVLAKEVFEVSEVDPTTRPFQLTIDEFNQMACAYSKICERYPSLHRYNYRAPLAVQSLNESEV